MEGSGDHHVEQNKPGSERQISHFFLYAKSIFKNHTKQKAMKKIEGALFGKRKGINEEGER
jgi:hypothetical protein